MSFTDDYLANRKKKKKEEKKTVSGGNSFTKEYLSEKDDIAPVASTPQLLLPVRTGVAPTANTFTAPVRPTTKDDSRKWFKSGAFDDGYQFGDVTKTILGTAGDAAVGVVKGIGYMGEGVADLISYGGAAVQDALGNHVTADAIRERTAKSATDILLGGLEKATDKYSVLGDKSDSITQGLGQVGAILATGGLAGMAGLGTVGATALTTGLMGASSAGSGMGEAYLGGATDEEAATYGLIKGVVDAGSELLFGGLGKAVKAVGLSKGLTSVDDLLAKKLSGKITNHIAKNFVEYGVKASAEGMEEVIAGVGSAMAKQATYMSDKELKELLEDENLMEQFVVGAVTSGIAQSGIVPGMKSGSLAEANKTGRDFITGLSTNEQQVIDKVYEDRVAEAEKDGKKLTNKEKNKLYDSVVEDMDKGYISIDTIEEVLGGDTYKTYRETVDSEDALAKEFEELGNKQNATLAEQSRYNELKQQIEGMKQNSQRDTLKTKLGEEVFGLAKDSRLAESYAERSRRGQAFEADLTQYDSKQQEVVRRAAESGILNNTRRTHEFVDLISKISADKGVLFDFTNNEKLKESGFAVGGKTVDGYVTKDGITLNMDSPKAWQTTVGHEITHVLEGTELYDSLRTTIFEYAKSKGEYDSRLADIQERYKGIENADYEAELTSDLVGDYLFADENFIKHLSVNNRNVFQKIYDEVKYMLKVVTAGSKEARQLEKVKRAFDRVYKENGKTGENTKYSLDMVEAVQPKSDKWSRTHTTEEAMARFPNMWNVAAEESEVRNPTQITSTVNSYRKIYNFLQNEGFNGTILDASSGLGYGTRAGIEEYGFNVDDIEPYPDKGYKPKYQDYSSLDKKYDVIISNAVLNVLPQDQRDALAVKMGELLNDGGRLFVNVRGKDVETLAKTGKNIHLGNMEWIETVKGSYQKGFTKPELVAYLQDALGDGFTVKPTNMFGAVSAVVTKDGTAKYSVSDSDGKQLSKEQQEYFKDSKMRDEDGNLKVMYHGTPNGDFTVFKDGTYFTDNKAYADVYQSPSASSISTGKVASAPKIFEVYLDIKKPFDINDAEARNIYINDYIKGGNAMGINPYLSDAEYAKIQTIDWTEGEDLRDFLIENGYDYDGLVLDEGATGGYGDEVQSRGKSYVVFSSEQVKNIDNQNPTSDPDIRFSLSKPVEETKDLMALHNLSGEKLQKVLKLGGLPMPSIAIAKATDGHDEFGNISLILPKEVIDPKANSRNKIYSGDAWTPTYPRVEYKANDKARKNILKKINALVPYETQDALGGLHLDSDNMNDTLNRNNGDMVEAFKRDDVMKYAYLKDSGSDISLPVTEANLAYYGRVSNDAVRYFSGKLVNGLQTVELYQNMGASALMQDDALKEAVADAQNWDVLRTLEHGSVEYREYERNPVFRAEEVSFSDIDDFLSASRKLFNSGIQQTVDKRAARELIRGQVNQTEYEAWLRELFADIVEKEGIRNNKDYFTPSGNRRSFEALHYEHNLENVIKAMREKGEKGIGFGGGSIFGAATTEFSSVEEMKQSRDRLQKMSDEEYQAMRDEFSNRFFEIAGSLPNNKSSFMATDDAANTLIEAVAKYNTRSGIANYLRRELNGWATYSDQAVDDLIELVRDIRNMPTGYFEAKPQRAVGFDEVAVFVIPYDVDPKLKQELLNRGYSIAEYDPNVEGDRKRVLNRFEEYKFSLSDGVAPVGKGVPMRDLRLETVAENATVEEAAPDIAPVADNTVPKSPVVSAENATTTIPSSPSALADIAKQGRRENMRGAYTHNGKQYLSDGSFIAEFNTVDESLEQSGDFPIKQAIKELDEAFARQADGKYDLHTSDTKGFVKVGNSLFGTKRVNALIRALENPVFSLANVRGGHEALLVTGDNGRAVLMPVSASGNAYLVYEAQPIAEAATFTDDFAPVTEDEANAIRSEAFQTVDDRDMPPEMEAPYQPSQEVTVDDPFEDRDWYEVGNRKVKAYMYENPEVKPFFQEEAAVMLDELNSTTKGERWYDDHVYYDTGGEAGWGGTKRHTSESIAEMLDNWKMSYDDIEKGLKAIIEDHGAENIAAAKKIEFMLNERLLNGYTSFVGFEPTMDKWGNVPPNQSYLAMLEEKQVTEYSKEAFDALMAEADRYAPVGEAPIESVPVATPTPADIAPVAPAYEVVSDKKGEIKGQQAITKEDAATGKTAKILVEEPEVEKKQSAWSKFKNLVLDKGMVFEDLSIRTGNRELQARWNSIRYARNKAQRLMEKGNASVSSLDSIRKTVEGKGKEYTQKFYEYLYHMHNIDRMSLESEENRVKREGLQVQFQGYTDEQLSDLATSWITKDTPQETVDRIKAAREYVEAKKNGNKPVFGDDVTADISRKTVSKMEKANPEFKEYAKEVYGYMNYLRGMLVDNGVISNETAKLWNEMYPHYVPIRRLGDTGLNINVPLDTGRTGVNAPVKRATGGSRDILPLFDTMGQRTMQTFSAVAKNRFGVELKNTLGTTIGSEAMGLDEAIDSIDTQDGLLQEGKKGKKPTFTVFEDGKRVTFEITEEMYDAMKPTSDALAYTNKLASAVSDFRRNTLTQYNPWFMLKNAIKDVQDVLVNSQHATRTYVTIPKAISQMVSNGQWYTEYMENGGEDNSYFDSQSNTFKKPNPTIEAIKKYTGLNAIAKANNIIERLPRLAEYIASREAGRSIDVAMLDAARVTTNFAAGGDLTKFLNRNGATFLNASFQGAMQQVRNVREAKRAGVKGVLNLAAKFAVAGLPAIALNALIWGDDEEYEELSDYVKQSYYIVGKTEDGKFIRIPKGRTVAVIQNGFEQMQHLITGDDEADLGTFLDLLLTNLAPNNPIDNNILSPIIDVAQNKTWYGEDLVPTRLQDVPNAEQYDESTDSLSRWLGETFNVSPYKTNYLLDQYGGIIGDTFLPMLTPEAESGNDTFAGNLIAPLKDMFTTDSVMNNQNVSDFYDTKDELTKAANSMYATDEDVLKAKYMNSVNSEMGKLYGEKRELQNSDMPDAEKYEAVREVQRQIDELAKSGLDTYNEVLVSGGYATVGDRHYRKKDGEWSKLTDDQLEKQEEVTSGLGISPADYWSNKEEYDFAYEKPEKYAVAKAVGGYDSYQTYSDELYDIKADKDENGDSIRNSRKEKVIDWVNNLDADYGTRIILFKSEYNADDTYNYDIIEYLNNRDDISYDDMVAILKELGFDVDANGNISWD